MVNLSIIQFQLQL